MTAPPQKLVCAQPARCSWATATPLLAAYHDDEWGVPEYDRLRLFEKLLLDGLQAGLSWRTILERRAGMRAALHGFDPTYLAALSDRDLAHLLVDPRLIRNRQKVYALRTNAQALRRLEENVGNFSAFLWGHAGAVRPRRRAPWPHAVPTESAVSRRLSVQLRAWGFSFCGPTIVYAFMQAVGMVNDHVRGCHRAKRQK